MRFSIYFGISLSLFVAVSALNATAQPTGACIGNVVDVPGEPTRVVNTLDMTALLNVVGRNPAKNPSLARFDLNRDGLINGADIAIQLASYGPCPTGCPGDFNGDRIVSALDLTTVLNGLSPNGLIYLGPGGPREARGALMGVLSNWGLNCSDTSGAVSRSSVFAK